MSDAGADLVDRVARQIHGPDDLVQWTKRKKRGRSPADLVHWTKRIHGPEDPEGEVYVAALHEIRTAFAFALRSQDERFALAIDANHRYLLEDGRRVSLLHLTIIFGKVDLASVLASSGEFPICQVLVCDLGPSIRKLASDQAAMEPMRPHTAVEIASKCGDTYSHADSCDHSATFWQGKLWCWREPKPRDGFGGFFDSEPEQWVSGRHGWVRRDDLSSSFVFGGAQGQWVFDWSFGLFAARARRDVPSMHAALAAIAQGAAEPSLDDTHLPFLLLDTAILFGEVAAVAKLVSKNVAPVPLRLWRASDLLPCYGCHCAGITEDDLSGKGWDHAPLRVPEPAVVHAASVAKINLCSLRCQVRNLTYDEFGREDDLVVGKAETLLEAVVLEEPVEIAEVMLNAGGDLKATQLPDKALQSAKDAKFQVLEKAVQLGMRFEDGLAEGVVTICARREVSACSKWWEENRCPGRRVDLDNDMYFGDDSSGSDDESGRGRSNFLLSIRLLELAVLHGEKELALSLAEAGFDFTKDGAFAIRAWLVGAAYFFCRRTLDDFRPSSSREEVRDIAIAVLDVQRERNLHQAMKVMALPLIQVIGGVVRAHGRMDLRMHPAVKLISGFVAQRAALTDLYKEVITFAPKDADIPVAQAPLRSEHLNTLHEGSPIAWPKQVAEEAELQQTFELSNVSAEQEESSHVASALLHSKVDAPPLSGDDAVVYRLTRVSQSIIKALLEAPELAEARARVCDAGCEMRPDFGGGATFFIPVTRDQFCELNLQLASYHVVMLRSDRSLLEGILAIVPSRQRPNIKHDHRADAHQQGTTEAAPGAHAHLWRIDIPQACLLEECRIGTVVPIVRHTFIHFPDLQNSSKVSVQSAPGPW